jgi:uncharacterized membrane protein
MEQKVMANVALIYTVRKMVGKTALKLYVILFSIIGITFFVSVPHVAENFSVVAQGGVGSIATFILAAVLGTTVGVQIALVLGTLALASLVADYVRINHAVLA